MTRNGTEKMTAGGLPSWYRWAAKTRLHNPYTVFALAASGLRSIPLVLLRGATRPHGRPGILLVAGQESLMAYFRNRFFCAAPEREPLAPVSMRALPSTLLQWQSSADLIIARVDRISVRMFFREDYLAVPESVGVRLTAPFDAEALARANDSVRGDLRRIRQNRLQSVVSRAEADFDTFYRTMYVPYIINRHGQRGSVLNARDLRRAFHRGGILWIMRDAQPMAAVLFERNGRALCLRALGTPNGELTPVKQGAFAASYLYAIDYARQQGCEQVDFGGGRPSLHDSLLRYKRKWGVMLCARPSQCHYLLMRWCQLNSVVMDFLSHTSVIYHDKGGLSAVGTVARDQDRSKLFHDLWMPGLRRLDFLGPGNHE